MLVREGGPRAKGNAQDVAADDEVEVVEVEIDDDVEDAAEAEGSEDSN